MKTEGFTLIEIVVSVGIVLAVIGAIIVNYNSYNDRQTLKQAGLTLKNNLRFAQTKALSGEKPPSGCTELSGWTVTFAGGTYAIQAQCDPEGSQGPGTSVSLPASISFSPVPAALTFRTLSQGTTLVSPVTITVAGFSQTYSLEVSPGGDISDIGLQ